MTSPPNFPGNLVICFIHSRSSNPSSTVPFNQRALWTTVTPLIVLVYSQVPLYGIMSFDSTDPSTGCVSSLLQFGTLDPADSNVHATYASPPRTIAADRQVSFLFGRPFFHSYLSLMFRNHIKSKRDQIPHCYSTDSYQVPFSAPRHQCDSFKVPPDSYASLYVSLTLLY
jgi:hypothetical protein